MDRASHWERVYSEKAPRDTSWFEDDPTESLDLLLLTGLESGTSVIDIGAGRSPLPRSLVDRGLHDVTALDVSREALDQLDSAEGRVTRVVADITSWLPERHYDRWHDRAVLHFLSAEDAQAYRRTMLGALSPHGAVVIGVFSDSGPESCSGLPVTRYREEDLLEWLGPEFLVLDTRHHTHHTPWGAAQDFVWVAASRDPQRMSLT